MQFLFQWLTILMVAFFFVNMLDTGLKLSIYIFFEKRVNLILHAMMEIPMALFFGFLAKWVFEEAGTLIYAQNWGWLTAAAIALSVSFLMSVSLLIVRITDVLSAISIARMEENLKQENNDELPDNE